MQIHALNESISFSLTVGKLQIVTKLEQGMTQILIKQHQSTTRNFKTLKFHTGEQIKNLPQDSSDTRPKDDNMNIRQIKKWR